MVLIYFEMRFVSKIVRLTSRQLMVATEWVRFSTYQTANETLNLLTSKFFDKIFQERVLLSGLQVIVIVRLRTLFSLGVCKSMAYDNKPTTFKALEDNIRRNITEIRPDTLEKSDRLCFVRISRGSHLPGSIFKS